jgi:hypothetical protein
MPRFDKDPQYRRAENNAKKRADWFATFNREAMIRDAWIISSPGSQTVTIECLPGNPWVQELKERGFPITWIEDGQRILPHEVREEMTIKRGRDAWRSDAGLNAGDHHGCASCRHREDHAV